MFGKMETTIKDETLREELLKLIDETRNRIPSKSETRNAVITRSFIVFALGCVTGILMYTINLFLTSRLEISLFLLALFFVIGFLMGTFAEKMDLLNIKSKYGDFDY